MDDFVEAEELPSYAGIRPLALAVFRDGSRILVEDNAAWDRRDWFYRPPGGGVEFGERAEDALRREMHEEFNAEVTDVRLLGTLESIFDYHGQQGHEIVFVFDARFADASHYAADRIVGHGGRRDSDRGHLDRCVAAAGSAVVSGWAVGGC